MRVLVAEDNAFYRRALKATLVDLGYEVFEAADGAAAWEILQQPDAPRIAVLDVIMPKITGLELCRRIRSMLAPEPTYIIILTSLEGKENVISALEAGADDFIHKPFDREQLHARLRVGKRIVDLQTSQTIVFAFARAVEAKSPYTLGHSDRVARYALALGDRLSIPPAERETLRKGALLHDIGKIAVPDAILNKEGSLTVAEFEQIRQHPKIGYEMAAPMESLRDALPLIRWHHEKLNGRGYPDGLSGDGIPLLVRILSVVDIYDALASARPYRPALPHEQCLETLRADAADGGLDAELVEVFAALAPELLLPGAEPIGYGAARLMHPILLLQDSA